MSMNPRPPGGALPLAQQITSQVMGGPMPGAVPPGAVPPGAGDPNATAPGQGAGPPLPHPGQQPMPGAPAPGDPPPNHDLDPETIEKLKALARDEKARGEIEQILRQVSGQKQNSPLEILDPSRKLQIAQMWNARKRGLAKEIVGLRGKSVGVSKANDEALLVVWNTTPMDPRSDPDDPEPMPLDDIEEYADACRIWLISQGWTDWDKIEDQTMRYCFPLRESLIRDGRPGWREQYEFAADMVELEKRWKAKYGELPRPTREVQRALVANKGKTRRLPRDEDSEALPATTTASPAA